MYSTNTPQKLILKASKNISFTKTLARTNKICSFQQDITVYLPFTQLPTSTSPPSRTAPSSNTSRPRFPSPLQRSLWPPEALPDCRRIGGCSDARGPADLLAHSGPCDRAPPPGAGWVVDGRQQGGTLCRGEMGLVL
jgi:hypothetical protein